jgi:hypothetical protein
LLSPPSPPLLCDHHVTDGHGHGEHMTSPHQGDHAHNKATTPTAGRPRHQVQFNALFPLPVCFGTVGCGAWAHPARLDFFPSTGTSLLGYERGVPVARPHGGREDLESYVTATTSQHRPRPRQATHGKASSSSPTSGDPRQGNNAHVRQPRPCQATTPTTGRSRH